MTTPANTSATAPAGAFDHDRFARIGQELEELVLASTFDVKAYRSLLTDVARVTARARYNAYEARLEAGYGDAGDGRWAHHRRSDFEHFVALYPKALAEHPRSWCYWTAEEEMDLEHAVVDGVDVNDISRKHQRTTNAIQKRMSELDLKEPGGPAA